MHRFSLPVLVLLLSSCQVLAGIDEKVPGDVPAPASTKSIEPAIADKGGEGGKSGSSGSGNAGTGALAGAGSTPKGGSGADHADAGTGGSTGGRAGTGGQPGRAGGAPAGEAGTNSTGGASGEAGGSIGEMGGGVGETGGSIGGGGAGSGGEGGVGGSSAGAAGVDGAGGALAAPPWPAGSTPIVESTKAVCGVNETVSVQYARHTECPTCWVVVVTSTMPLECATIFFTVDNGDGNATTTTPFNVIPASSYAYERTISSKTIVAADVLNGCDDAVVVASFVCY